MTLYLQESNYGQPAFLYMPTTGITLTASSTKSGTAVANLLQPEELLGWQPTSATGSHTITLDFGSGTQCDCLALLGTSITDASLAIDGSNDNSTWASVQAATALGQEPCAYAQFTAATWRYWRLTLTDLSSITTLYHLTCSQLQLLPFFDDGFSPYAVAAVATDLISPAGLYLGTVQQRTMATFDCPFSQVTTVELETFSRWADACVVTRRPCFFIPDTSTAEIHFAWTDSGYKFAPKYKNGLADIGTIKLTARASL